MKYQNLDFDTIPVLRERARIRNFQNQWGLASIQAQRAYAHVELLKGSSADPGDGVTIGFVDSGIDPAHQLLAGANIDTIFLLGASAPDGTRFSHGTAVASVAAAPLNPRFTNTSHGVAYGADIAMFAIPTGTGSAVYNPVSLSGLQAGQDNWVTIVNSALAWRDGTRAIDFLNLSVGVSGIIENYSTSDLRTHFATPVAAMAQAGASEKTVLVWAAGNAHGDPCDAGTDNCEYDSVDDKYYINATSVEVYPGLVARFPELQGHTVAVVATGENGRIADFSNRCGIAANWCLAAPGDTVSVAYYGPRDDQDVVQDGFRGIATVSGTSFSAPMVSGGLAVMKHLFRNQLSNTALLSRLLETANDSGVYADRSVYGHGLMDLGAATSPVGVLEVAQQDSIGAPGSLLQTTQLQTSPAFGDGLEQSWSGHELAAFDALGAPFWFELADFAHPAPGPSMGARLQSFLSPQPSSRVLPLPGFDFRFPNNLVAAHLWPPGIGPARMPSALLKSASHFSLAPEALTVSVAGEHGLEASAFTTEGTPGQDPVTGAHLAWRPGDSPFALRAGWLGERETLLGSMAEGAFGNLASNAIFFGAEADADIAGWQLGARAEIGRVQPASVRGLITRVSALATSAFAVHASREMAGAGTLRLSVSQPLRIEGGHAQLTVPTGRTPTGSVVHRSMHTHLAPSGRQVDVAAHWTRPLARGEWRLLGIWSREPQHRKAAGDEHALLTGWLYTF